MPTPTERQRIEIGGLDACSVCGDPVTDPVEPALDRCASCIRHAAVDDERCLVCDRIRIGDDDRCAECQADAKRDADDAAIRAIVSQLDAAIRCGALTHQQLAYLPSTDDFAVVDLAVRQWATLRKAHGHGDLTITEDAHQAESGRIEVYRVCAAGRDVVTVHRPRELHSHPKPAAAPRLTIDSDALWSPADGVA